MIRNIFKIILYIVLKLNDLMSENLKIQQKNHENSLNPRMIVEKFNYFNQNFTALSFSQF